VQVVVALGAVEHKRGHVRPGGCVSESEFEVGPWSMLPVYAPSVSRGARTTVQSVSLAFTWSTWLSASASTSVATSFSSPPITRPPKLTDSPGSDAVPDQRDESLNAGVGHRFEDVVARRGEQVVRTLLPLPEDAHHGVGSGNRLPDVGSSVGVTGHDRQPVVLVGDIRRVACEPRHLVTAVECLCHQRLSCSSRRANTASFIPHYWRRENIYS